MENSDEERENNSQGSPSPEHLEPIERTKKRDPGKITQVLKIGVVGDGTVGKTTLLLSYITGAFLTDYVPTVFDNFSAIEELDGKLVNVLLWDTAGQDDYAQIRTTCYTKCQYDLFLLCFSTVHQDSFDNIKYKWIPELKNNVPNTPFILVGTKTDIRDASPNPEEFITTKKGQKLAKEIRASTYLECSSRSPESVGKMVLDSIHAVVDPQNLKREKDKEKWRKQAIKEEQEEKKRLEKLAKEQAKLKKSHENNPSNTQ